MTTLFIVNEVADLDLTPATAALVRAQAARGPTAITTCADLSADGQRFVANAREIGPIGGPGEAVSLTHNDLTRVLVRANPVSQPTAWAWAHGLSCLAHAEQLGLAVHNNTATLARFAAKPGLLALDETVRPPTVVTGSPTTVRKALTGFGRSVIKPAHGSQGKGVFIVNPDTDNLSATIDLLLDGGPVVVQPWLPAAVEGDVRVFVSDGEVFEVDGRAAAIRRRPAAGELRSNIHLGGHAEPTDLVGETRALAERAAAQLLAAGARFAGVDCIGDRIVEVNVCAPGGLQDMSARYGVDFVNGWLDRLVAD